MQTWQLQHAKKRLSEVVDRAATEGPQVITRRGVDTVVVVSIEEYRRLTVPKEGLVDFLRASPLAGVELGLEKDRDAGREVEL